MPLPTPRTGEGRVALVSLVKSVFRRKPRMAQRLHSGEVTAIALCKRGKNGIRPILKADGAFELSTLVKAAGKDEVLAVVYAPERLDDDRHFAEAATIKSWAHAYLRDHRALDIEHDGETLPDDAAYVAESFIIGKGDERFKGWKDYEGADVGDLTDSWGVRIKLEHPVLQKAWADGELDGVSLFGKAAAEQVDITKAAEEDQMDEAKLKELFGAFKAEVVTLVKSAVAEAVKPPEKPAEPLAQKPAEPAKISAPEFTGDPTNPADLEAFEKSLRTYELRKALSEGKLTAEKIAEMRKAMAESEPTDQDAGVEIADNAEVKRLKRELFKARKVTNAPEGAGAQNAEVELAKANHDEGLAIAKLMNDRAGATSGMRIVKGS